MTKSLTLLGATLLVGSGFVLASSEPIQQTAPAPAQAKPVPAQAKPVSPEEQAIRGIFASFLQAYTKADAKALGELFIEDGVLIDSAATLTRGREAITKQYADIFEAAGGKSAPAVAQIDSVALLTPQVARVEGSFELKTDAGAPAYAGDFRALAVQKDGKWLIAEIRDDPAPISVPESNEVYLKELEWMVGEWVDEGDSAKVTSSVKWSEKNNFLVRTYSSEVNGETAVTGTQYIGYDPLSGQIRSWVFDSEGGHAEGFWTRSGDNQWVIKSSGVLRDGTTNSSTQVVTQLNKDSVSLSAMDRIVGGEIVPDVSEIVMVRKAPAPAAPK